MTVVKVGPVERELNFETTTIRLLSKSAMKSWLPVLSTVTPVGKSKDLEEVPDEAPEEEDCPMYLLADKVVPQHATGSTGHVSELIGIKDVQGIVGCVIDDGLRTRQVEKADVVRRVPGNEVSGANDFDGTGGFAGEVGDRRIIVLEDATETVVNDPESVERVNISRVRIAEGSSLDDATGMRGSTTRTDSNSER